MSITIDQFIKNIDKLQKQGCKLLEKEILDLFEPIVYQYVLYTRPDTGRARKEIGESFARYVGSDRIIRATEYDVEVTHEMYDYWNDGSRADEFSGNNCSVLAQKGLLKVVIVSNDIGLINQERGELPSPNHPREPQDDTISDRLQPYHLTVVSDSITTTKNLEYITNANIAKDIAKDVQQRVKALTEAIERVLFNGKS